LSAAAAQQIRQRTSVIIHAGDDQERHHMTENTYQTGRLNLPFVGHCTFAKAPVCLDWEKIDADVAVIGVPNDMGTQWRSGARFGPRAIREASTLFSFGHAGAYDHEDDKLYLTPEQVRIMDVGDADIVHTDVMKSHANTELAIRKILAAGAMPVALGGDHSVHAPIIKAFDGAGPIHIIQFDAHLDFVNERHGVRYGHGNPLRRASEMAHISGMTQLGIRNVSSSNFQDYEDARSAGSKILSVRQIRKLGVPRVLDLIPAGKNYYLTIDIDGFDPSIAPGTGTPSHGGFLYYEVLEIIQALVRRGGTIVGIDLVEVAPAYDLSGITSILAAQLLMNSIGFIFYARQEKLRSQKKSEGAA
jgi:agmatinase